MPSVVIPAFNEGPSIERCLRSVLAERIPDLALVVVPNGCRDDTAARARSFGSEVCVVETPTGGKTHAINLGEQALRERGQDLYPRLFLDGDIELLPGALSGLFAATAGEAPRVVAAEPRFDASSSTLPVRLFYAAERFNPYHFATAPNGSGTYCVSRAGRSRWGEFPDLVSDDGFVERMFVAEERLTVLGARAIVRVPRSYHALRRMSARQRLGSSELQRFLPPQEDQRGARDTLRAVASASLVRPHLWPAFAVWVATRIIERLEERRIASYRGEARWQQDRTTRS